MKELEKAIASYEKQKQKNLKNKNTKQVEKMTAMIAEKTWSMEALTSEIQSLRQECKDNQRELLECLEARRHDLIARGDDEGAAIVTYYLAEQCYEMGVLEAQRREMGKLEQVLTLYGVAEDVEGAVHASHLTTSTKRLLCMSCRQLGRLDDADSLCTEAEKYWERKKQRNNEMKVTENRQRKLLQYNELHEEEIGKHLDADKKAKDIQAKIERYLTSITKCEGKIEVLQ